MDGWQINEAGVDGVLKKVQAAAEPLSKDLAPEKFTAISSALTGGGGGGLINGLQMRVPQAVGELMTDQTANLQSISNHISAGVLGVSAAKAFYHNGNADMCTQVQTHMKQSADSGDFSWWKKEGLIK